MNCHLKNINRIIMAYCKQCTERVRHAVNDTAFVRWYVLEFQLISWRARAAATFSIVFTKLHLHSLFAFSQSQFLLNQHAIANHFCRCSDAFSIFESSTYRYIPIQYNSHDAFTWTVPPKKQRAEIKSNENTLMPTEMTTMFVYVDWCQ